MNKMAKDRVSPDNYWISEANKHLKGRKIVEIRYLTTQEMKGMGWMYRSIILILNDGTMILPSRDDEGNDAGALFGQTKGGKDGERLTFPVLT